MSLFTFTSLIDGCFFCIYLFCLDERSWFVLYFLANICEIVLDKTMSIVQNVIKINFLFRCALTLSKYIPFLNNRWLCLFIFIFLLFWLCYLLYCFLMDYRHLFQMFLLFCIHFLFWKLMLFLFWTLCLFW